MWKETTYVCIVTSKYRKRQCVMWFLAIYDHLFLDWKKMENWEPNRSYTQYVPQTATSLTHSYSTAFTTLLHSYTRWPAMLYQLQVKHILLIMTCSMYKYCWTLFCKILIKGRLELYTVIYCVQDKAKYASAQNRWPTTYYYIARLHRT